MEPADASVTGVQVLQRGCHMGNGLKNITGWKGYGAIAHARILIGHLDYFTLPTAKVTL
jgi:hypothetical protein